MGYVRGGAGEVVERGVATRWWNRRAIGANAVERRQLVLEMRPSYVEPQSCFPRDRVRVNRGGDAHTPDVRRKLVVTPRPPMRGGR